jgi:DMSO/TMAO reductase YedYZ molybdopterin-dependent catalytic subunit
MISAQASAEHLIKLPLPGRPDFRPLTDAFTQKGTMIRQRTRPPLLETPFEVFDKGIFTPNEQFYVRWHWALIPNSIDVSRFRLAVRGHVGRSLSLTLPELLRFPVVEIAAVNQCSGNSRGLFVPPVPGAQWDNGAMGNAKWTGVRLKDVLDLAGVKTGAIQVRFSGLDDPVVPDAPKFRKSLGIDHARSDDVIIAYAMNGQQLPLLNGFPVRLVVPGWYSTYWVKMLSDIEVLDKPDDTYWMTTAYTIPDTPYANVLPGAVGVKMVPISRMVPRSFITNLRPGANIPSNTSTPVRGLAMGGDCGVSKVELSVDGGKSWRGAALGTDEGPYSFRQFTTHVSFPKGTHRMMARCTNTKGEVQPLTANWNPGGFMRNVAEQMSISAR